MPIGPDFMPDGLTFYLISNADPHVRAVIQFAANGHRDSIVRELSRWEQFYQQFATSEPCCIVIDFDQINGLEQIGEFIASKGGSSKIVLLSSRADLQLARRAFPIGIFDCLAKPVDPRDFQNTIDRAVQSLCDEQKSQQMVRGDSAAFAALTPRERDYFSKLLEGWSIKTLAMHFQVSIQTAAKHRSRVLAKLQADNEVELVHRFGSLVTRPENR